MKRANVIMGIMKKRDEAGFTITELMFAMTFIAFIMLFTVMVLLQLMSIYNKGIAMAQINQTGRQLADDMKSEVRFAPPSTAVYNEAARRLCVGGSSYLWNTEADREGNKVKNYFSSGDSAVQSETRLGIVRIADQDKIYCTTTNKMPAINQTDMTILAGRNIGILEFKVEIPDPNDMKDSFIKIHMVLSTSGSNKPEKDASGNWKCFSGGSSNPYCAFGEFNNTVYMRGGQQ